MQENGSSSPEVKGRGRPRMADSYRPTPVRLQQNGSSCGEGGLEVVGREQVRGGVSGSERISLADCAVEGETAHAPGGSPALLPTPPTPPPLGLAEPGRSDGCGGLEWLGVAFAVPQKRGASGRGLRCPPSRWNGWAWPSLSPHKCGPGGRGLRSQPSRRSGWARPVLPVGVDFAIHLWRQSS